MALTTLQVSPDTLIVNPWNTNVVSPDNDDKLEASIRRFGLFKPIVVRELDNGDLQILGGEHRVAAAKRVGLKLIPIVNLGKISDTKAKEIGLVDNGRFGADDTLRLAELLSDLGNIDDLATFMPYTEQDLSSIFSSSTIELDDFEIEDSPDDMDMTPKSAPTQTHQIMRFKVPLEDVSKITKLIEKTMKVQNFADSDSLSNAGDALVHLLTKSM